MARYYLLLLSFLNFISLAAHAQSLLWEKSFGGTRIDNNPKIRKAAGSYILCGNSHSGNGDVSSHQGFVDAWLMKVDSAGTLIWEQSIGGGAVDIVTNFRITEDGGFILCGHSYSATVLGQTQQARGLGDAWMARTDSNGALQWTRTFGGWQPDYFFDVMETADGGFIATGYTMSDTGDVSYFRGGSDLWVVKTDSVGNLLWQETYGGSRYEIGHSIAATADGAYLIGGSTDSYDGQISNPLGWKDGWILKISPTGLLLLERTYGGSANDDIWELYPVDQGHFVVIGETRSDDGDIAVAHGLNDAWMFRIDGGGQTQWSRTYGGSQDDGLYGICDAFEGEGYMLSGFTHSWDGDIGFNHDTVSADAWVVMTDRYGWMEWEQCYGGENRDVAHGVVPVSKDQFLVSASTSSITGDITHPRGDVDYWLFRLVSHIVPTGVKQSEASGKGFLVYPTVTDGLLHAQLPAQGGGSYYVYHISGKLVSQGLLSSGDGQISLGGLVPGMYLVRLDQSGSTYHSRILVK